MIIQVNIQLALMLVAIEMSDGNELIYSCIFLYICFLCGVFVAINILYGNRIHDLYVFSVVHHSYEGL